MINWVVNVSPDEDEIFINVKTAFFVSLAYFEGRINILFVSSKSFMFSAQIYRIYFK